MISADKISAHQFHVFARRQLMFAGEQDFDAAGYWQLGANWKTRHFHNLLILQLFASQDSLGVFHAISRTLAQLETFGAELGRG
jgi:hypothetical protein